MSQLTGETVVSIHKLTVNHDTASYTCAKGNHDEILKTTGCAIGHLADSGSIGIIGDSHGDTELLAHHLSQRQRSRPRNIHEFLYHSCVVVGIGRTDTYTMYLIHGIVSYKQTGNLVVKLVDVSVNIAMFESFD